MLLKKVRSMSQITVKYLIGLDNRNIMQDIRVTSLSKMSGTMISASYFFCSQLEGNTTEAHITKIDSYLHVR